LEKPETGKCTAAVDDDDDDDDKASVSAGVVKQVVP
jgi:hypothetical protein